MHFLAAIMKIIKNTRPINHINTIPTCVFLGKIVEKMWKRYELTGIISCLILSAGTRNESRPSERTFP